MRISKQERQSGGGFSLGELLLSIAIIAILLGLLLPLLGRARASAQQTSCLGQLRQIYTGMIAYTQEHRGYLPRGATGKADDLGFGEWRGAWMSPTENPSKALPAYLGGQEAVDKLVVCPSNRHPSPPASAYTPYGFPYVCNYEAMTQNGLAREPANLWRVNKAKLILLVDSDRDSWKGPGFTNSSGWDRIGERHNKQFNALWADGRVTALSRSQLRPQDLLPEGQ